MWWKKSLFTRQEPFTVLLAFTGWTADTFPHGSAKSARGWHVPVIPNTRKMGDLLAPAPCRLQYFRGRI